MSNAPDEPDAHDPLVRVSILGADALRGVLARGVLVDMNPFRLRVRLDDREMLPTTASTLVVMIHRSPPDAVLVAGAAGDPQDEVITLVRALTR